MKPICFVLGLVAALAGTAACGGSGSASPVTPTPTTIVLPTTASITVMPAVSDMLAPKTLGNTSAPNTIVEYGSFWCPGCKQFYSDVFPLIKSQYIDSGRASFTFVNIMLSYETTDAAMLARCSGSQFFDAVDLLYRNQDWWRNTSNTDQADKNVTQLFLTWGMSQSVITSCLANSELLGGIRNQATAPLSVLFRLPDGTTVDGIKYVPAIVVNGIKLDSTNGLAANKPTIDNIAAHIQ